MIYSIVIYIFSGVQMNALRAPKALNICGENKKSVKKGHSVIERCSFEFFTSVGNFLQHRNLFFFHTLRNH